LPHFTPHDAEPSHAQRAPRCTPDASAHERLACAVKGSSRALLAAAEEGDVSSVAHRVTSDISRMAHPHGCRARAGAHLLSGFAAYVADDSGRARSSPELMDAQVRTAARDVAHCSDGDAGKPRVWLSLVPSHGVRATWNGAYVNAFGADGFRIVPSVALGAVGLRLGRADGPVQVGVRATLLDLVAPFAELAMRRPDISYDRQGVMFLEIIKPRIEAAISTSATGRHLAFVGGVSMRTAAPFFGTLDPASPRANDVATYLTPFSSSPARSERFASFVEVGAGISYTF
jgi:hypothetical protein